jgi:hypothetical protein
MRQRPATGRRTRPARQGKARQGNPGVTRKRKHEECRKASRESTRNGSKKIIGTECGSQRRFDRTTQTTRGARNDTRFTPQTPFGRYEDEYELRREYVDSASEDIRECLEKIPRAGGYLGNGRSAALYPGWRYLLWWDCLPDEGVFGCLYRLA